MGRKKKSTFQVVDGQPSAENLDMSQVEREYIDILNYRRKQKNNLLGNFSSGEYKIPDELVEKLIAIPKIFDHFDNNFLYAAIKLGSFVLNFRVEMDIQPDFCRAKLYIIEMEQGIEDDTKHITLLDEVLEVYSPNFRESFEKRWNIVYGNEAPETDDFLERYLSMQSEEFMFNRELEEILAQLYILRMLSHLATMGLIGEKISFEYKLLMEKHLAQNPSFSLDFTLQKELLDFVIFKFNGFEAILKTEEGMKILQGYSQPLKNVRDKTYPSVMTEVKTAAKAEKEAEKATKTQAKKPAASKSKSSSEKKPKGKAYDVGKAYKSSSSKKKEDDKKKSTGTPATGISDKGKAKAKVVVKPAIPKPSSTPAAPVKAIDITPPSEKGDTNINIGKQIKAVNNFSSAMKEIGESEHPTPFNNASGGASENFKSTKNLFSDGKGKTI